MCEKYKNKKIFICQVRGTSNEYSVLAKDSEEAKNKMVKYVNKTYGPFNPPHIVPYDKTDIYCIDIESIRENMINGNNEIEFL